MDPVTQAIVFALAAGTVNGIKQASEVFIKDSYDLLKNALKRKFGEDSNLFQSVKELEAEPDFKPNIDKLAGRIDQVKAHEDPELLKLAQEILGNSKSDFPTVHIQQHVEGKYNVTSGTGDATLNISSDNKSEK